MAARRRQSGEQRPVTSVWQAEAFRAVLPHLLAGCIGGAVGAVAMLLSNLGGLRDLVQHSDGGWLAFALLTVAMAITFGSVAIGGAVMGLAWDRD